MVLVDVSVRFSVSPLDGGYDLLAEDYHLLKEEDVSLLPPGEDVSCPTGALPDMKCVLQGKMDEGGEL